MNWLKFFLIFSSFIFVQSTAETVHNQYNYECWRLGFFTLLFFCPLISQLIKFKKYKQAFSYQYLEDSLIKKVLKGGVIILVILALIMSLSLVTFLIQLNEYFYIVLFIDIFVFHIIYKLSHNNFKSYVTEDGLKLVGAITTNFINTSILIISLITFDFLDVKHIDISPELFRTINSEVCNGCYVFQDLLRTQRFFSDLTYAIKSQNLGFIGDAIFVFFYITSLSIVPMTSITLIYMYSIEKINNYNQL